MQPHVPVPPQFCVVVTSTFGLDTYDELLRPALPMGNLQPMEVFMPSEAARAAALKAEGFAWIAERAARQQGLRVATLKTEGAAAIEERDARQAGLKAATLKMEGAAAIEQRATTQQGLKVAMLKTEGQNVINMREVRQAQLGEKAAAADLGDAPEGFVWGGVY